MKSVIFDLDGVLVSTDELHYKAWENLARELGIDRFTRKDNEKLRGISRMESLEVVLAKGNKLYSEEEKRELAHRKNEYYKEMLKGLDEKDVLDGAFATLRMLREMGVKTAVGSASKNTPAILEKTGLLPYFTEISCGLDTEKSKPDPEVFLIAAQKLGERPENCVVVEDSAAGILAARTAKMKTVGVGPYYDVLGADYKARGLFESQGGSLDWEVICAK